MAKPQKNKEIPEEETTEQAPKQLTTDDFVRRPVTQIFKDLATNLRRLSIRRRCRGWSPS